MTTRLTHDPHEPARSAVLNTIATVLESLKRARGRARARAVAAAAMLPGGARVVGTSYELSPCDGRRADDEPRRR